MKKKIYILLTILIIISLASIYLIFNKSKLIDNKPIETINCTLNNKVYSFDIFFDEENLVYKTETNENLIIPFIYKTEEELSNMITSIYENKGAVCNSSSSFDIEIEF